MVKTKNRTSRWGTGFLVCAAMLATFSTATVAQPFISTKGGLLNVVEGKADVHNPQEKRWERARPMLQMNAGEELRTRENSRVEMLLNPGSFARLGPETTVRLLNNRLTELSLVLLSGSMAVEAGNIKPKTIRQIQISVLGHSFSIIKDGIYRFDVRDSGYASARVFRGAMETSEQNGKTIRLKKSRVVTIDPVAGTIALSHFEKDQFDNLDEWSEYRAGLLSSANQHADRMYSSGYWPAGYYSSFNSFLGGWFYDPFYGFYTFLPGFGYYSSPFGYYYPVIIVKGGNGSYRTENVTRQHEILASNHDGGKAGDHRGDPSFGSGVMSAPSNGSMGPSRSEGGGGGHREGASVHH